VEIVERQDAAQQSPMPRETAIVRRHARMSTPSSATALEARSDTKECPGAYEDRG
jgi:hypothetical protein